MGWDQTIAMLCPMHRHMVEPNSLAGIISFLLSDAAKHVNGTNLPVDQVRQQQNQEACCFFCIYMFIIRGW